MKNERSRVEYLTHQVPLDTPLQVPLPTRTVTQTAEETRAKHHVLLC